MQPLIISSIHHELYQKKFRTPYFINGVQYQLREGYYLTLSAGNLTAKGEASPLEGYSFENLKKCLHDLKRFSEVLVHQEIPLQKEGLFQFLRQTLDGCCSTAKFAIESACIDLVAKARQESRLTFLGGSLKPFDDVVLLQGNSHQVRQQVIADAQRGYRYFKLKVGDRNIPLDVTKVRELRAAIGPEGRIRLDANRAWQLSEAILFAHLIGREAIEFIEEPLSDPSQLPAFFEKTQFPIALDETLATSRVDVTAPGRCMPTLANHDAVAFYVIKPSLIGGVLSAINWINQAKRLDKKTVLSAMFETPVGMSMLRDLSHLTDQAPGFGTESWLL